MTRFLMHSACYNVFEFECACGFYAELGIPERSQSIVTCPDCNAPYIQRLPTGMFAKPALIEICVQGAN